MRCGECDDSVSEWGEPVCDGCFKAAKRYVAELERQLAKLRPTPNPANFVKVFMEGESPWVYRISETETELVGRVDNDLICTDLHGYRYNDVVRFKGVGGRWVADGKVSLSVVPKDGA